MDYESESRRLKAMGHPTRLRILDLLADRGSCVQDLERELGLRQSNVSQHLRVLLDQDLVTLCRDGHTVCYSLNRGTAGPLLDLLRGRRDGSRGKRSSTPKSERETRSGNPSGPSR